MDLMSWIRIAGAMLYTAPGTKLPGDVTSVRTASWRLPAIPAHLKITNAVVDEDANHSLKRRVVLPGPVGC